ncbi:MAG: hypothetical protein COV72_02390 [Candidatus Omnitrophica bacterium CG11_big_fil_rev_8_21_14_0_20_42_13]|uniref:Septation protein spoVG n=1 Tax=Candidatus Ghiorseimicrobium undicola TaxID=1974746 RepID=A0A2H0LYS1_9BACT|nr:MAG: hypothetical protein COV72_02390 [Candidatus Omnitrophica bacterium CG11_big_fil_rev_8_21_14_0_20_42_13]
MTVKTLEITVKRIFKIENNDTLKAFVDIAVNDVLLVKGLRIVNGKNGLFVSMPQTLARDDKWYSSVYPLTKEAREEIQEIVLASYNAE